MGICSSRTSQSSSPQKRKSLNTQQTEPFKKLEKQLQQCTTVQTLPEKIITENAQEKEKEKESNTNKNFQKDDIFSIKFHKLPLTKFYSVMRTQVYHGAKQQTVQNNLTGKIKHLTQIQKDMIEVETFINNLKSYNLRHPNLIQIYEVFQDSTSYYIIQEYFAGGTLQQYAKKRLSEDEILKVLQQVMEILTYFSDQKIYPQNLAIDSFCIMDESEQLTVKYLDIMGLFIKNEENLLPLHYIPPEQIAAKKSPQNDSWASWFLGILTYQLVTGNLPFEGNNEYAITSSIKKGVVSFDNHQMEKTSSDLKELIRSFLKINPASRLAISAALKMKCFATLKAKHKKSKTLMPDLQKLKSVSFLQSYLLLFMIKQYYSDLQQQLYHQFTDFDENKDGLLSKEEMLQAYQNCFGSRQEAEDYVNSVFQQIDIDNSGTIDFQEFIIATTDKTALITKSNCKQCFRLLANSSGVITPKRLSQFFQTKKSEFEEYFKQYKPDNKLNFQEFEEIMFQLL